MFEWFNILFANPTTNLLVIFFKLFESVGVPYAFGFSIIALTVAMRILLYPFMTQQIKSAHKMQKVAPHISALKEKYKGDSKKQQEEMMKIYREHGVNPAAGCLPLLIQIPITIGLYNALNHAVNIHSADALAGINKVLYFDYLKLQKVWDTAFFGLQLGDTPSKLMAQVPLIVLVPVLTGALQFILSKMMMPEESLVTPVSKAKEKKEDDFQSSFQKQSLLLFPAMIGFFSFTLPVGLSLYWNTFTIFGILQQYILIGPGAATPYFKKLKLHGRRK
jgi:YidC/Oxa1 family membrane protein insertase